MVKALIRVRCFTRWF